MSSTWNRFTRAKHDMYIPPKTSGRPVSLVKTPLSPNQSPRQDPSLMRPSARPVPPRNAQGIRRRSSQLQAPKNPPRSRLRQFSSASRSKTAQVPLVSRTFPLTPSLLKSCLSSTLPKNKMKNSRTRWCEIRRNMLKMRLNRRVGKATRKACRRTLCRWILSSS